MSLVGQSVERGQRTEDRGQRTEDRGERTEDRGQRTERAHASVYYTIYTHLIYNILYTYKLYTYLYARWRRPAGAVCCERAATSVCGLTLLVYAALRY